MDDLNEIEEHFKKYSSNIHNAVPEGVIDVDLGVLQKLDLLNYHTPSSYDTSLTRYFHVIETKEKITLVNEQFIVWIVPEKIHGVSITYSLIALNLPSGPKLELVFSASGVYNNSMLVLRVLEKYLSEIQENEEFMKTLK
jgi:hypothetical protein